MQSPVDGTDDAASQAPITHVSSRHQEEEDVGYVCRRCWFVLGIGGATCAGKSTLAAALVRSRSSSDDRQRAVLVSLDDFFRDEDDPSHVACPGGLDHLNWDTVEALDVPAMSRGIDSVLASRHCYHQVKRDLAERADEPPPTLLVIEGFLALNVSCVRRLCHMMLYIDLERGECEARRSLRQYHPPDVPGYFELCVWPMHERHRRQVLDSPGASRVHVLDGTLPASQLQQLVEELLLAAQPTLH